MIENGDEHAKLIYDAMALNVARKIGEEAATVAGDIEAIILTGGIAYSEYFTNEVKKMQSGSHRLSYIRVRMRWNLWHLADFVYCVDRKKHTNL